MIVFGRITTWDLGLRMFLLVNTSLEYVKAWQADNRFWERIPLDNSQWKEGILIVILCCMSLNGNTEILWG